MPNQYSYIAQDNPVNTSIPLPFAELMAAGKAKQDQYDTTEANQYKLESLMNQIHAAPWDEENKKQVHDRYLTKIQEIGNQLQTGDVKGAKSALLKTQMDILGDKDIQTLESNYQNHLAAQKLKQEYQKDYKYFPEADPELKHIQLKKASDNKLIPFNFSGMTAWSDPTKDIEFNMKDIKSTLKSAGTYGEDKDGRFINRYGVEGVDPQDVYQIAVGKVPAFLESNGGKALVEKLQANGFKQDDIIKHATNLLYNEGLKQVQSKAAKTQDVNDIPEWKYNMIKNQEVGINTEGVDVLPAFNVDKTNLNFLNDFKTGVKLSDVGLSYLKGKRNYNLPIPIGLQKEGEKNINFIKNVLEDNKLKESDIAAEFGKKFPELEQEFKKKHPNEHYDPRGLMYEYPEKVIKILKEKKYIDDKNITVDYVYDHLTEDNKRKFENLAIATGNKDVLAKIKKGTATIEEEEGLINSGKVLLNDFELGEHKESPKAIPVVNTGSDDSSKNPSLGETRKYFTSERLNSAVYTRSTGAFDLSTMKQLSTDDVNKLISEAQKYAKENGSGESNPIILVSHKLDGAHPVANLTGDVDYNAGRIITIPSKDGNHKLVLPSLSNTAEGNIATFINNIYTLKSRPFVDVPITEDITTKYTPPTKKQVEENPQSTGHFTVKYKGVEMPIDNNTDPKKVADKIRDLINVHKVVTGKK